MMNTGDAPEADTHCASWAGICESASAELSKSAPRKIKKIIPVLDAVPRKLSCTPFIVSSPLAKAAMKVARAPTDAASVGENKPL